MIARVSAITRSSSTTRTLGFCLLLLLSAINRDSLVSRPGQKSLSGRFAEAAITSLFEIIADAQVGGLWRQVLSQVSGSLDTHGYIACAEDADRDKRKSHSFQ